jgi:hypothetical protein
MEKPREDFRTVQVRIVVIKPVYHCNKPFMQIIALLFQDHLGVNSLPEIPLLLLCHHHQRGFQ